MKINTNTLLVVNRFEVMEGQLPMIEQVWANSAARKILTNSVLYKGLTDNTLMLLYEISDFAELQQKMESTEYQKFVTTIKPFIASDFHQQIVGLVEKVRERETSVPTTPFMQLRYIEVPLSGIKPYLEWRRRRIFEFVKRNDLVHSFHAFHSVFSTQPGVLFVVEFNKDPEAFRNSFLTPEYQQIIKEAGHDHIKGGLYTTEYQLAVGPLVLQSNNI